MDSSDKISQYEMAGWRSVRTILDIPDDQTNSFELIQIFLRELPKKGYLYTFDTIENFDSPTVNALNDLASSGDYFGDFTTSIVGFSGGRITTRFWFKDVDAAIKARCHL